MRVQLRLNLPKAINKLTLRYNTFEKVSYDKYFIASLISNTNNSLSVYALIDEMTGKGSLNEHFKKVYLEMEALTSKEISSILKDSLYPIQKIEEFTYTYIPMTDISIFNGKVYIGHIKEDELFARQLVDKNGTYVSHKFTINETVAKVDYYEANLGEENIKIKFNKNFYNIKNKDFVSILIKDDFDFSLYGGNILSNLEGNDWIQLNRSSYNNIANSKDFYYDDGDHIAIYSDNVKKSSIAYSWGLYWIKEKTYKYNDTSNQKICENVAQVLLNSGRINEFKTKSILDILKNIQRDKQKEVVDYILRRKDSKEIAKIGLILMSKGYEKGWSEDAKIAFYKFRETTNQLIMLYRVNSSMQFPLNDILEIYNSDKTVLSDKDLEQTKIYFSDCESIRDRVKILVGGIVLSGTREKEKSMVMDDETRKFRSSANKIIGHFKKNIDEMDLFELKQFEKRVNDFYDLHKEVIKRYKEQN